jgi:hypothetical protein
MTPYEEYQAFIAICRKKTTGKIIHHIQPKAFRPDLIDDPDNLVALTAEQHMHAHWLIAQTLPVGSVERRKMIFAFKNCVSAVMKELHHG